MATAQQQIAEIYLAAFNRVPDSAGLAFWVDAHMNKGASLDDIAKGFTTSQEYTNKYSAQSTSTDYVQSIYHNVFGRAADADGLKFWSSTIDNGSLNHATLMNSMLNAAASNGSADGVKLVNQAVFAVTSVMDNMDSTTASHQLSTITSDPASMTAAVNAIISDPAAVKMAEDTMSAMVAGTTATPVVNGATGGTAASINTGGIIVDHSADTSSFGYITNGGAAEIVHGSATAFNALSASQLNPAADTLIGGSGIDVLSSNAKADTLTGNGGNNFFGIAVPTDSSSYSTITDAHAGDSILFGAYQSPIPATSFNAAAITASSTSTFSGLLDAATASTAADHAASWFQYNGNTYIVQNNSTAATFIAGSDAVVKLTGLIDLSHAAIDTAGIGAIVLH